MDLQFYLSSCSDVQIKNNWMSIKDRCENGNNEDIVEEWLQCCQLEDNKNATFMNTLEGGIILPNNNTVRFRYSLRGLQTDNYIVLNYYIVDDILTHVNEIFQSLNDLLNGFVIMLNNRIGGKYARGKLSLAELDTIDDSSDSE
jgi:hypothetical protein